jgi:hypothetical protein
MNSLHPAKGLSIAEASNKHCEAWTSKLQRTDISNLPWLFTQEYYVQDDAMNK